MPMTEIALAAGFGSVRRFNETFQRLVPPAAERAAAQDGRRRCREGSVADTGVTLRLRYRPPYDWPAMLALPRRPRDRRRRAGRGRGLSPDRPARRAIWARVEVAPPAGSAKAWSSPSASRRVRALPAIVARVRRVFDLGADVDDDRGPSGPGPAAGAARRRAARAARTGRLGRLRAGRARGAGPAGHGRGRAAAGRPAGRAVRHRRSRRAADRSCARPRLPDPGPGRRPPISVPWACPMPAAQPWCRWPKRRWPTRTCSSRSARSRRP